MAFKKDNKPLDWTSLLQSDTKVSSEEKNPSSAFSSLLGEFKKPETPNKSDHPKRKNFNKRRPPPRKEKTDSGDHDKNENKLTRSNILPVSPSDEVQVKSYIDLLEEFLGNTDDVASPTKSDVDCFISVVNDFENSLQNITVNGNSKLVVLEKLLEIQNIVSLKIKSLDPSYNRTEHWVKNQLGGSKINLSSPNNFENVETSSNKSNTRSNVSYKSTSSFTLTNEELKVVNCQYCCELLPDLPQLIKHLDDACWKFRERDFDTSKRNDLSYFQIMPDDKIKCNLCDLKFHNLLSKKEHNQSPQHISQVEKNKARDTKRSLTNYIYCACCKVNVPDTFIQYKMHVDNPEHIENRNNKNLGDLAEKGVQAIIMRRNRVKCLACSHVDFNYDKEKFQLHLKDDLHIKNVHRKKMDTSKPIFCELCTVNLPGFSIDLHINSKVHSDNLKTASNSSDGSMKNQYCLFCNKPFSNLIDMAVHQECGCPEIRNMRRLLQTSKENGSLKSLAKPQVVNRNEEETDEEPFLKDQFLDFFQDKNWVENAAVLLKDKSDKCIVDLDESIAKELAKEVGCKNIRIFGSRNCGLAFDTSDLNIFCDFFGNLSLALGGRAQQIAAEECFEKLRPNNNFEQVQSFAKESSPYIQCVHKNSSRICKVVFKIETSELESDFFKACFKEDPRIQQFLLCLKLWLKVHSSFIGDFNSFVMIMLGVFFLRSKAAFVLAQPPLSDTMSKELKGTFQSMSAPTENPNELTVADLFLKFCKFYKDFDYSSRMIFTGVNEPLLKKDFESALIRNSEKVPENQFTNLQCLWVVSYLNSTLNIGKDVTRKMLNRFVKVCDFTANRLSNS